MRFASAAMRPSAVSYAFQDVDADLRNALAEEAEVANMLSRLGDAMGTAFRPKSLPLPGGGVMELDGFSAAANVLCEVMPQNGPLTPASEEEAVGSALKLLHAAQVLGNTARLVLLFRNRVAAKQFCSNERARTVIEETGVEVRVLAA